MKTVKFIGNRLKIKRRELNYSQEQVGLMTNLTKNTISNIELGNTDFKISNLIKIMQVLKIDFEDLGAYK